MKIKNTDINTWTDEELDLFMQSISSEPTGNIGIDIFRLVIKQFRIPLDLNAWKENDYKVVKSYFCKTERSEYGMKEKNQICCIQLHDKTIGIDALKHAKEFLERSGVNAEISEETLSGLLMILLDINTSVIMDYLDEQ